MRVVWDRIRGRIVGRQAAIMPQIVSRLWRGEGKVLELRWMIDGIWGGKGWLGQVHGWWRLLTQTRCSISSRCLAGI